jgi:hypothetical protein
VVPCLRSAVSSTISTASRAPTSCCAFAANTRSSGAASQHEPDTNWCSCR